MIMKTEKFIESAMMSELRNKGIDKIKVSDIIRDVGTCKGTFYRYYRDKYELLVSCFRHNFYDAITAKAKDWENFVYGCLCAFEKESSVVLNAFDSTDVNSIRYYHENLIYTYLEQAMTSRDIPINKLNMFAMRLCASCYTNEMLRWLSGERKEDKIEMVRLMSASMPNAIVSIRNCAAV